MLTPNHGCAVQANIAAMVVNPETLVVPRATDPIVAAPVVVGLQTVLNPTAASTSAASTSSAAPAAGATP